MTLIIILTVVLGAFAGYFLDSNLLGFEKNLVEPILYMMVFCSGLTIGYDIDIRKTVKKIGLKIILTPIFSTIGSLIGGIIVGKLLGLSFASAGAVASGLGWYSLSAVMIEKYDTSLGALAFMCNIFRELQAFVFIPLIAKYIGYIESIAPGGATSMDTTLSAISRVTDETTTLIAFTSGVICMMFVPSLVQLFIAIGL